MTAIADMLKEITLNKWRTKMKLDKIRFARLIAYLGTKMGMELSEIEDIDNLIDIEVPMPINNIYVNADDINEMLRAMVTSRKLDAIRLHRQMTGMGLKESKDMIELVTSKFAG